jgi:transposase
MQGKVHDDAMAAVYVGIDVCKERLDIHLHPAGASYSVANDAGGWRCLRRRLMALPVALVVLEATSKYHRAVHRRLDEAGIAVALVNPLRARLFAEASGQLAKTDAIDARMLALMGAQLALAANPPPPAEIEALQELVRARASAVAERVALANRMETAVHTRLRRELASRLRGLEGHVSRLNSLIEEHIARHPRLASGYAILCSIPGIGPVTATALLAHLDILGRADDKQITALAGLAPMACDSGGRQPARHIRGGRPHLRKALYMAALTASRCNPDLKRFYQRLTTNGKPPKLAITAVMRKLLVLANCLIAQNRSWVPVLA